MKDNSNQPNTQQTAANAIPAERARKIGTGHLKAFGRQGFKELSSLLQAFPDSIRVVEEPGLVGNPTNYEVSKQTGAVNDKNKKKDETKPNQSGDKASSKEAQAEVQPIAAAKSTSVTPHMNSMEDHEASEPEMD